LKYLLKGNVKTMDTGKMNEKTFLCVCGFGFDAFIAHKFAVAGKRGRATYAKIVYREVFKYKSLFIKYRVGEMACEENTFVLSVANGAQFGNSIFINPLANEFDGKLNLTVIKPFPRRRIWPILLAMRFGRTQRLKEFKQFQAGEFAVQSPSEYAHIDGEPIEIQGEQKISIMPASLKILIC